MTIEKRVNNGIKWLNKNIPGWESRIDLDKFVFDNVNKCILGQLGRYDSEYCYNGPNWIEENGFEPYYENGVLIRSRDIENVWREKLNDIVQNRKRR
jgi:hypothetical protein